MPTLRRSVSLSSFGSFTSCPSTVIEPPSIGVSALMQRMKVDLPEPEGPMTQTTSPFISSSEMPFSTWRLPNDLCTSRQRMIGRSEEHTSELQSLMRISYAVFCLKKKKPITQY